MKKFIEIIKSPHIQIAFATGISIVIMAYVSKRVLEKPIGYLTLAIPPFIALIFETVFDKYKNSKFLKTWYWVTAVLLSTAIIIILHLI